MWGAAATILLLAAAAKTMRGGFDVWLGSTGMFPGWAILPLAHAVVGLEALTCVLLVWPRLRYYGWVATGALGAAFATIHVASAILGDVKPCRCFAVELSHNALWSHLGMTALSAGLVVMAFVGVRQRRRASPVVEGDAPCRSAR